MQVDLRDSRGKRLGRLEVDPAQRPTLVRVNPPEGESRDVFLQWEQAIDDAGSLRHCLACGGKLYRTRTFPQVTPFVVVLAGAGVVIVALGYATNPLVYFALTAVLLMDVLVLLLARSRLVCYRCGSGYDGVKVARYHRRWDPHDSERTIIPPTPAAPPASSAPPA